jgi:hypothetical protein
MRLSLARLKQGRLSPFTQNILRSLEEIPIHICQFVPRNTKAFVIAKLPAQSPTQHNDFENPNQTLHHFKKTHKSYIKASGMPYQPYRVINAAPIVSSNFSNQPLPSSQQDPQPFEFLIHHQYLDGTEIRYETIQTGVWEAGETSWGPEVVVYQSEHMHAVEYQTPPLPQSRGQGCLNELVNQVHALPGNYGSDAPAYLLKVPREPVDKGGVIVPLPSNTHAAMPVELDGQNMEPDGQVVETGEQITESSQAARTEPQQANVPKSLEAIVEAVEAARTKPKQSRLRRYLQSVMGSSKPCVDAE